MRCILDSYKIKRFIITHRIGKNFGRELPRLPNDLNLQYYIKLEIKKQSATSYLIFRYNL